MIEERLDDLNSTMQRVDFQPGRYLRLVAKRSFMKACAPCNTLSAN